MCELCKSIDVRRWHRDGRLRAGQQFPWSWSSGGEPSDTINVRTEADALVLIYRARSFLARVEIYRTADTDHLDELPLWWSPSLVCLFGPGRRQILWTPRRRAVCRWRIVRVPMLLQAGLRQPAEPAISQHQTRAKDQDAARGQSGPVSSLPRAPAWNVQTDVFAPSGEGRGRRRDRRR